MIRPHSGLVSCWLIVLFVAGCGEPFQQAEFKNAKSDIKKNLAEEESKAILKATLSYVAKTGSSPERFQDLFQLPHDLTQESWGGPHLAGNSIPRDPWDNHYRLEIGGEKDKPGIRVRSFGPNGKGPDEDDILISD